MKLLAVAALLALSACGGAVGQTPETAIFDCDGGKYRYRVHDSGDGNLALEIEDRRPGPVGVSTYLLDWSDMRTGYVTGQQGGHQSHLRLFDGDRHYVLFEGNNGALSESPGASYAGVSLIEEGGSAEEVTLASCDASETNSSLLESVRRLREAAGLPALAIEEAGSPFDGWF